MIIIPWIVFIGGCAWMIWKGTQAKKEYVRQRKMEDQKRARDAHSANVLGVFYPEQSTGASGVPGSTRQGVSVRSGTAIGRA